MTRFLPLARPASWPSVRLVPIGRSVLAIMVSIAAVGCAPVGEEVAEASAPIVGGVNGGDRAVVVLQNYRSGGLCTGALIAERVVLTAKHCVQEAFAAGPVSPNDIVVGVGDSARATTSVLRVQSILTTPGSYRTDSRGGVGDDLVGIDVAVMILTTGVSTVEPLPIRRESHQGLGGQLITATGFGETPSGQVGVKFTATGRVTGTTSELIYVGALICSGDSGGPAVTQDGQIAGVVSFGSGACGSGIGAYNAIFPFLDMIDQALIEAGSCLNDGEERCDGADNDCDEQVDETCTPLGGACGADDECVGLTCRDTSGGRICTNPCDPLRPDFGCEPGFFCARSTGCDGFCVPQDGDASLPVGADCTEADECSTLFCTDPGDGRMRCLSPCRGDTGMCLAGEACAATAGACGGCVEAAILRASRGVGEECAADSECASGACLEDAGRFYCTRDCAADAECPSGYHCRDGEQCVSGPRGDVGDPCVTNGDCAPMTFCAAQADREWCTRVCDEATPCPEGFGCVVAGTASVCAPDRGLLGEGCMVNDDCVTELCGTTGAETAGSCTRMCGADAACSPGFECRRTADGTTAVCVPPAAAVEAEGGGCAVGARSVGAAPASWGWMLAVLATIGVRRRRGRA